MVAPLSALLPKPGEPPLSTDQILDRFVAYVSERGLELYPAQEEAVLELLDQKHLVLATPTGSGKSLVAVALHFIAMCRNQRSVYTCPIKALVNEKFFALCEAFGPEHVGMATGDASINRDAPILVCTAEVLSNRVLREASPTLDAVVMDEFHYYADKERGVAWQIPLLTLPATQFLLMSATLGDTQRIEEGLTQVTGRKVATVRSAQRPVPLDFEYRETPLHETISDLVGQRKAPIYVVNFTQRAAAEEAQNLTSVDFCTKAEKEEIREALFGARFDTPYGKELQRFLRHGLGLHHAGLLPKYRLLVEKLAQQGHLKIISGTDTLGVGVNIPIRTVLFTQLCKYDGEKVGILPVREFHQIAGRAGRRGFDTQGSVVAQAPEHVVENLKLEKKAAQGKKVVKKQPPQKGYAHWDRQTFDRLVGGTPEPLQSRFEVSFGMVLSLLQSDPFEMGDGYLRLVRLVHRSHESDHHKRVHLKRAAELFRTLRRLGIVLVYRRGAPEGVRVRVNPELQPDFSLHQTLSLYVVQALDKLDPTQETYALDVLTLVEAILEDPDVVLYAQLHKLKGEKLAELKAQGMEYDQRMEELEKLEWPKPLRELIYGTFDAFVAQHPWVGQENIRPKSVARDVVERFASFNEYVSEYGLARSEGVLLRYLSEAYKTLVQNVPEAYRTEAVEDVIAYLRVTVGAVDTSLLEEWERLRHPELSFVPHEVAATPAPPKSAPSPKALKARIRAELHRLLKALGEKDFETASACVFQPDQEWPAAALEAAIAPYFAEHEKMDLSPRARQPIFTHIKDLGARKFEATQRILDASGEGDWVIECEVDLSRERAEDAPLIQLRRISR